MQNRNHNNDWEERLKRFPQIWSRVQSAAEDRPARPPMPGHRCCTRAVRFNPQGRGRC